MMKRTLIICKVIVVLGAVSMLMTILFANYYISNAGTHSSPTDDFRHAIQKGNVLFQLLNLGATIFVLFKGSRIWKRVSAITGAFILLYHVAFIADRFFSALAVASFSP